MFNKPTDSLTAAGADAVSFGPLIGTWNACNKATRGIARVVIGEQHGHLTVNAFGACSPTPCDWHAIQGLTYATSVSGGPAVAFTAIYRFNFKDTIVIGVLDNG